MAEQTTTNIKTEKTVSKLADAICEFKKLDIAVLKQSKNGAFKRPDGTVSKYADLATIFDAVEIPLAEMGVVIVSHSELQDGEWVLVTELVHKETLERMVSVFPLFGNKAQEIGSSVTYARRYNIQSLLNLAAEDDDGNAANRGKPIKKATKAAPVKESFDYDEALDKVSTMEEYDELKADTKESVNALPEEERKAVIAKFVAKKQQLTKGV